MSRRTLASLLVACLLGALGGVAALLPVPYVTMVPGRTVDLLGDRGERPIISVQGRRTYPTEGGLRLTTVSLTAPSAQLRLAEVVRAWADRTQAVYPRSVIYPPEQSVEDVQQESVASMVNSQDTAVAAALTELGYRLRSRVSVVSVREGAPASGRLRARDRVLQVNGVAIKDPDQVARSIQRSGVGQPATFVVRRGGATERVEVTAEAAPDDPGRAVVGVQIGTGYDFPFEVSLRLDPKITGPSAGLVFALGVYDRLTPGSLAGGAHVAGTGTIDQRGRVGPVGGIQQKIVAARDAGATLFLVPPDNCAAALGAHVKEDDITLVEATTMTSAVRSLEAYAADRDVDLPDCR